MCQLRRLMCQRNTVHLFYLMDVMTALNPTADIMWKNFPGGKWEISAVCVEYGKLIVGSLFNCCGQNGDRFWKLEGNKRTYVFNVFLASQHTFGDLSFCVFLLLCFSDKIRFVVVFRSPWASTHQ